MSELSYEQRKRVLTEEIATAFDGVSREGGVSLSEARVIDDYGSPEAQAKARELDSKTRWQDVPETAIGLGAGYSNLSFLDEIGFRYYIPAYMVWYLRYIDEEDPECPHFGSNTFDSLIFKLTLGDGRQMEEFDLSRFRLFTPEQAKAIAHFLEFDADRQDRENIEWEPLSRKNMNDRGYSKEEIDVVIEDEKANNSSRIALKKYWGQFLSPHGLDSLRPTM